MQNLKPIKRITFKHPLQTFQTWRDTNPTARNDICMKTNKKSAITYPNTVELERQSRHNIQPRYIFMRSLVLKTILKMSRSIYKLHFKIYNLPITLLWFILLKVVWTSSLCNGYSFPVSVGGMCSSISSSVMLPAMTTARIQFVNICFYIYIRLYKVFKNKVENGGSASKYHNFRE